MSGTYPLGTVPFLPLILFSSLIISGDSPKGTGPLYFPFLNSQGLSLFLFLILFSSLIISGDSPEGTGPLYWASKDRPPLFSFFEMSGTVPFFLGFIFFLIISGDSPKGQTPFIGLQRTDPLNSLFWSVRDCPSWDFPFSYNSLFFPIYNDNILTIHE